MEQQSNYFCYCGDWGNSLYCILEYIEGFDDDYKLGRGDSLTEEWPDGVAFRMSQNYKNQIKLSDNLLTPERIIIASKRLSEFFLEKEIKNLEYLPVTIINHKNRVADTEYSVVNLVTTQDCVDIEKSGVVWNKINSNYITSFDNLVLDEERIDEDALLFRAKHISGLIFIRKDLARQIEEAGFTGIYFVELSEAKGWI